jgi:glucose/arabinose dehydrogenase
MQPFSRIGGVRRRAYALVLLIGLTLLSSATATWPVAAAGPTAPASFQIAPVFSGLKNPTDMAFSADGRIFISEKAGLIKVFDSLSDTTPDIFADMTTNVYKGPNDHGILGLALDPGFPGNPYVYVLYTYDAPIGGTAPRWNDTCPDPPGPNKNGCVVSGRLSRLQANGNQVTGSEQVLVEDWCQQFTSHSIGTVAFGADGALYASAGEGANTSSGDYGQLGANSPISYTSITPPNPCGDPPTGYGVAQTAPDARGGALRAQSPRRPIDEPRLLGGTMIRVDSNTGAGLPGNPLASSADANARRIVAYGLRNPFRFTIRPGTNELWIGDVGWGKWEEIDRISNPTDATPRNFGWPCYEGDVRQPVYDGTNLTMCEQLYTATNAIVSPYYAYSHRESMLSGDTCSDAAPCTSAISGLAFYTGGSYPTSYDGALFFADYGRHAIWVMFPGADGLPDPSTRQTFITGITGPVSMKIGPEGDLFIVDITGIIYRVRYFGGNQPPIAAAHASPTSGAAPLTVSFDASNSHDPDGDPISLAWDLDGDGQYDDSIATQPTWVYPNNGDYTARLKVTDNHSASSTTAIDISVGNTPPTVFIDTPGANQQWSVGDTLTFSGHATDAQDGALPPAALTWTIVLHHCYRPGDCHEHLMQDVSGASGTLTLEDHEDLPYLELRLTAIDGGGLSSTVSRSLFPRSTTLGLRSNPGGLTLVLDTGDYATPSDHTVIVGSTHTLIAEPVQQHMSFDQWSDGSSAQLRTITVGSQPVNYSAGYSNKPPLATIASKGVGGSPGAFVFNGAQSSDPEGDTLTYNWNFGDGASSALPAPTHVYTKAGTYTVTLTVVDSLGVTGSASASIVATGSGLAGAHSFIYLPVMRR